MTHDELLALGLTEDQAGAVLAAFDALAAQIANLQAQLTLRDQRDAVLAKLPQYQPRDAQILLSLIDLTHIDDGGLEEQIAALKKRAPYLFADAPDSAGGTAASGMNPIEFDMNAFLRGDN